jgi:hypothetical protein
MRYKKHLTNRKRAHILQCFIGLTALTINTRRYILYFVVSSFTIEVSLIEKRKYNSVTTYCVRRLDQPLWKISIKALVFRNASKVRVNFNIGCIKKKVIELQRAIIRESLGVWTIGFHIRKDQAFSYCLLNDMLFIPSGEKISMYEADQNYEYVRRLLKWNSSTWVPKGVHFQWF